MERSLNEYDLLKVFCVLLVIIGHVLNMYDAKGMVCIAEVPSFNIAKDCIYSFHMPVFVAISGAIYAIQKSKAKYNEMFTFVKKKFTRLIVPYILISSLILFPTMLVVDSIDNPIHYFVSSYILALNSRHLWFLLMLFGVFIVVSLLDKYIQKLPYFFILLFGILHFLGGYVPAYFGLSSVATYLIYFYMGYIFQLNISYIKRLPIYFAFILLVFCFTLWFVGYFRADVISIPMFLALWILAHKLKENNDEICNLKVVKSISKEGMGMYLFHVSFVYIGAFYIKNLAISHYLSFLILLVISTIGSWACSILIRKLKLTFILGE